MNAFGMPKGTPEEKEARSQAIQDATKYATEVPMRTIETSFKTWSHIACTSCMMWVESSTVRFLP